MSSPQITWDAEPQQIKWDDERPGVPKPPNPILNAPTPSALSRGATAFGAAAGDLLNAGSSMYGGGTPGESFTPQIGSPADKLAKSGDWRGAVKEGAREAQIARPGPISEIGGAAKGLVNMGLDPIKRGLRGDIAGAVGEAIPNAVSMGSGYGKAAIPSVAVDASQGATRGLGRAMEAHPYVSGHLVGTAVGEAVGHPYLGFIGGRFLEKPIKTIGQRLSKVGAEPPGGPFRDVSEPGVGDVFDINEQTAKPVGAQIARPSEIPAPIRMGPGQIPPDVIAPPNPRILAGNQGIRTTPIGLLPASVEGGVDRSAMMAREGPPAVTPPISTSAPARIGRADILDDQAVQDAMNADLESHGSQAFREASQERRARNDVAVPKWRMAAEIKAQQLIDNAQKKAEDRAISRDLGKGMPKNPKASIAKPKTEGPPAVKVTGEEKDLTPLLEKSLKAVKKKKAKE